MTLEEYTREVLFYLNHSLDGSHYMLAESLCKKDAKTCDLLYWYHARSCSVARCSTAIQRIVEAQDAD